MDGFTVYSGLKTVTIPQDVKEGDFFINFLPISEWNVPVERVRIDKTYSIASVLM